MNDKTNNHDLHDARVRLIYDDKIVDDHIPIRKVCFDTRKKQYYDLLDNQGRLKLKHKAMKKAEQSMWVSCGLKIRECTIEHTLTSKKHIEGAPEKNIILAKRKLKEKKIEVMIYPGDDDSTLPTEASNIKAYIDRITGLNGHYDPVSTLENCL